MPDWPGRQVPLSLRPAWEAEQRDSRRRQGWERGSAGRSGASAQVGPMPSSRGTVFEKKIEVKAISSSHLSVDFSFEIFERQRVFPAGHALRQAILVDRRDAPHQPQRLRQHRSDT